MKILVLNRGLCVLCGLCSPSDESTIWTKFDRIASIAFILVNFILLGMAYTMYLLYQLESGDIEHLLYACLQSTALTTMTLSYMTIAYQRKNTDNFFNGLQKIFDQCKFEAKSQFLDFSFDHFNSMTDERSSAEVKYLKTNELCEKLMKWAIITQLGLFLIPTSTYLVIGALFHYAHDGHIEKSKLYLPLKTR